MTSLLQLFSSLVKQVEGLDLSNYRTSQLKARLKHDFPQLLFLSSRRQNASEIVIMETSSLVDRLSFSSETEMESGESLSDSDYESNSRPEQIKTTTTPTSSTLDKTRILYNAGVIVKNAIKQCPGMNTPWPPTSTDLNCDSAAAVVPVELYNFLAWCVGASDEPCHDCFVESHQKLSAFFSS